MKHRPRVDETLLADVPFGDTHLYVTAERLIVSPPRRSRAESVPRSRIADVYPDVERRTPLGLVGFLLVLVGGAGLVVGWSPTVRGRLSAVVSLPLAPRSLLVGGAVVLVVGLLVVLAWWLLTAPVLVVEGVDGRHLTVRGEPTEEKLVDIRTALRGDLAAGGETGARTATPPTDAAVEASGEPNGEPNGETNASS